MINLLFFLSFTVFTTSCSSVMSFKNKKEMLKSRGEAIVKIEIFNKDMKLKRSGAGFLISKRGHFLVSRHVFNKFLDNPSQSYLKISNIKKRIFKNISFIKCGEKNVLDLCLLKINNNFINSYFPAGSLPMYTLNKDSISRSLTVNGSGHCKTDFRYYSSRAKFYRKSPYLEKITHRLKKRDRGTIEDKDLLILLNPHCEGDSGGPLFTDDGKFVGVFQEFISDYDGKNNYYIALPVTEIIKFISSLTNGKKINFKNVVAL